MPTQEMLQAGAQALQPDLPGKTEAELQALAAAVYEAMSTIAGRDGGPGEE